MRKGPKSRIRYNAKWWEGVSLEAFNWNGAEGPHGKSYDLFGDGSMMCVAIPGHADGLFAVEVVGADGRFELLYSDGATPRGPGATWCSPALPTTARRRRSRSLGFASRASTRCASSPLANHDSDVAPHVIEL